MVAPAAMAAPSKVFVAGAAGRTGRLVQNKLAKGGISVVGLVRCSRAPFVNFLSCAPFVVHMLTMQSVVVCHASGTSGDTLIMLILHGSASRCVCSCQFRWPKYIANM